MDLSQRAVSTENVKNTNNKKDAGKMMIYRLKS